MKMQSKRIKAAVSVILALCLTLSVGAAAFAADRSNTRIVSGSCTSFYMGKDATANGAYIWGRTEDFYVDWNNAKLFMVKDAEAHAEGEMFKSSENGFEWPYPAQTLRYTLCKDSIVINEEYYCGEEAYAEVGMNEKNVAISATVSIYNNPAIVGYHSDEEDIDGVDEFDEDFGILETDIPSVILMQATSAREACELLAEIIDSKGAGGGEGVMVSDPDEVWYFQILSRTQYIAVKCPDDKIGFSPNITGNVGGADGYVDVTDSQNVIASKGLFDIPRQAGIDVAVDPSNANRIRIANTYGEGPADHQEGRLRMGLYYLKGSDYVDAQTVPAYLNYFLEPRDGEKYTLYEAMRLLAFRGEGTDWDAGDAASYEESIGNDTTLEAHVFETRPDMPPALATIEWLCIAQPEFGVYLPYYGSLITDTFRHCYEPDAEEYDDAPEADNSMYWVFNELYAECKGPAGTRADRTKYGDGVRKFWERYQKSLIDQQELVDEYMTELYNTSPELAEQKATELSMAVAEETYGYAKQMLEELKQFKASEAEGAFTPSALSDENALPHYAPAPEKPADGRVVIKLAVGSNIYEVNGTEMTGYAAPIIRDEIILLPLRAIAEALDAEVSWNAETGSVSLRIGDSTAETVIVRPLSNGVQIIGDRTFVPSRYVEELFGADVEWDEKAQEITITGAA